MTTIGSGSSGIPSSPPLTDAQRDASTDAVADVKKAVAKTVEQKLDTTRTISDEFQQKVNTSLAPSVTELAKAQANLEQNFSPVVVDFIEQNLKVKIDPLKVVNVQSQLNADPVAKLALSTFKDAIEQTNQEFLASWKPPVLPVSQTQALELQTHVSVQLQTAQLNETLANAPPPAPATLAQTLLANANTTALQTQNKTSTTQLEQNLNSELQTEKMQGALQDQKSLDQSLLNSVKDPNALQTLAGALPSGLPSVAKGVGAGLAPTTPTPPATPPTTLPAPQTPSQGDSHPGGGHTPTPTPPQWKTLGGPPTPAQAKGALAVNELLSRLDASDAAEGALVVLMDSVEDVDKDIKTQMNTLNMQHKVDDAMRAYQNQFNMAARGLQGDQSLEWQQMSFQIGYDAGGNMIVQSFPDATWATGSYDHVEGKGAHDISPTEGFQNNTGANGMQEAEGNGSLHQVDANTVVGLTSWRQVKQQSAPAEADFIRSQISAMKQNNDIISQELQKLMDLRKNIIEQFGKIYQARSDSWDQQIATMAQ